MTLDDSALIFALLILAVWAGVLWGVWRSLDEERDNDETAG